MKTKLSLFEKLGGAEFVDELVVDFYQRVMSDVLLSPFFKDTDVEKLIAMQREFFTSALDGPLPYVGRPISEAHFGLDIERKHFAQFVKHLLDTLKDRGVAEEETSMIIGRVSTYIRDVTGTVSTSG